MRAIVSGMKHVKIRQGEAFTLFSCDNSYQFRMRFAMNLISLACTSEIAGRRKMLDFVGDERTSSQTNRQENRRADFDGVRSRCYSGRVRGMLKRRVYVYLARLPFRLCVRNVTHFPIPLTQKHSCHSFNYAAARICTYVFACRAFESPWFMTLQ